MKTNIIAPLSEHDIISKRLLKDNNLLLNTSIMPLNAFIDETIQHRDNNYDNDLKTSLNNLKNDLKVLNTYTNNTMFIKSIKDFHISMYLYDIKLSDLKNKSLKDQDLKLIFESIQNLIPNEIAKLSLLKDYVKNNQFTNTFLSKQGSLSNYEEEVYLLLLANGATYLSEDDYKINNVKLFYANNIRSEVEASAQLIIKNKLDNPLVIILNENYRPIIKQVYDRYNIINNLDFTDNNNTYNLKFIKTIELLLKKDKNSFKDFLSSNPFNLEKIKSLSILNDFFNFDLMTFLNYERIDLDDPILNRHDIKYFNDLNDKSTSNIEVLQNSLKNLISHNELDLIQNVFNYFQENLYDDQLVPIYNKLLKNKETLSKSENLIDDLKAILISNSNGLIISDHSVIASTNEHSYFDKKNVIILGASIKNYPNLKQLSGVIDETYVKDLNYPKKSERFKKQLNDLERIKSGNNIYIFYPLSSNEGKKIEPSFSLLSFAKEQGAKAERYPLIENDYTKERNYKLDSNLAKELFFDDGLLKGSISSFEQYNNCNYAYYLRYGLKLFPKSLPSLSLGYLGSVTHLIVENIVNTQIKENKYPSKETIIDIINEAFKSLALLNDPQVDIVKLTFIKNFTPVLKHLEEMDKDTLFKPIAVEKSFNYLIKNKIQVSGKIDRIDQYNDYIRVLDYKSSNRELKEDLLKQGLQLQLITYLMAAENEYKLKPAGAYYPILRFYNSEAGALKVGKRAPFLSIVDDNAEHELFINKNRIKGWHFNNEEEFYLSNKHYANIRMKDGVASIADNKVINFETAATIIDQVYLDIYDNLAKGIIDCKPINNPCNFCEFQSICLTNTSTNYKAMIYEDQNLSEEISYAVD